MIELNEQSNEESKKFVSWTINLAEVERSGLDYDTFFRENAKDAEELDGVTLIGFSKEKVLHALHNELTNQDRIRAIDEALHESEIKYEYEQTPTFHKFWLLDKNDRRCANLIVRELEDERSHQTGTRLASWLSEIEFDLWGKIVRDLNNQIRKKLVFFAARIVERESIKTPKLLEINDQQLDKLERGVLTVIRELRAESAQITNGIISGRLINHDVYNPRTGDAYSEEHISRKRSNLRKLGYDV